MPGRPHSSQLPSRGSFRSVNYAYKLKQNTAEHLSYTKNPEAKTQKQRNFTNYPPVPQNTQAQGKPQAMPTKRALIPTEKSWRAAQRAPWRRRARLGKPWAAKWPSEPRAAFLRQEPAAGSLCKMAARTLSASRSFPSFGALFSASTAAAQHRLGPRRLPAGNTRSPGPAALFAEAKRLGRGRNARCRRF